MTSNTNRDILVAGAFAAVTVDFLVYPLDTLKTRIQSPKHVELYRSPGNKPAPALFRGLYQGIGSVVVATIPSSGAFFTTYEGMKRILSPLSSSTTSPISIPLPTPILHSCASGVAETVSCAILTPAEVIKQNAQVVNASSSSSSSHRPIGGSGRSPARLSSGTSTLRVLARMRRHPMRLWSGYAALVARNLPFTGLQFPLYEALKARMTKWQWTANQDSSAGVLRHACVTGFSAGIAGSVAATVTAPIDVLKTRIMLDAGEERENGTTERQRKAQRGLSWARRKTDSTSLWGVGKDVYDKEGFRGLFRGGALRAGWTAIGLGLYLGSYEGGRMFLESRRESKRADGEIAY